MTHKQMEETILSVVALMMAGLSPNIFPAAQAGYAKMSTLATHLLIPSIGILIAVPVLSFARGHARLTRRLLAGAGAGALATIGLEAVRMTSFHLGGMPGDIPRLMGVLLTDRFMLGPSPLSDTLGWLYHFWNGASFGILFAVLLGRRSMRWAGVYAQLIGIGFMGFDMPMMPPHGRDRSPGLRPSAGLSHAAMAAGR